MKNADFFSDSNVRYGYDSIYRHNYADLFRGFSAAETVEVLLSKKTWAAGAFSLFLWGAYGIPIMLMFIWGAYFVGNMITRVTYAILGTSRKVRWHTNATLYFIFTSWIWVWFPAILFMIFIALGTIPYGVYNILMIPDGDYSHSAASPEINLIMRLVWDTIDTSNGPVEFILRFAFWDYLHPVASATKIMLAPVLGYLVFYRGHPSVTEEAWLEGEEDGRDAWLLYERRGH